MTTYKRAFAAVRPYKDSGLSTAAVMRMLNLGVLAYLLQYKSKSKLGVWATLLEIKSSGSDSVETCALRLVNSFAAKNKNNRGWAEHLLQLTFLGLEEGNKTGKAHCHLCVFTSSPLTLDDVQALGVFRGTRYAFVRASCAKGSSRATSRPVVVNGSVVPGTLRRAWSYCSKQRDVRVLANSMLSDEDSPLIDPCVRSRLSQSINSIDQLSSFLSSLQGFNIAFTCPDGQLTAHLKGVGRCGTAKGLVTALKLLNRTRTSASVLLPSVCGFSWLSTTIAKIRSWVDSGYTIPYIVSVCVRNLERPCLAAYRSTLRELRSALTP